MPRSRTINLAIGIGPPPQTPHAWAVTLTDVRGLVDLVATNLTGVDDSVYTDVYQDAY